MNCKHLTYFTFSFVETVISKTGNLKVPTAKSPKKIKSPVKIKANAWTETMLESPTEISPSENVVSRIIEFSGSEIVGGAIPKKKKTKTKDSKEELKIISDSTLEATTDLKTLTEKSPTKNVVRSEVSGSESIGGAIAKKKKTKDSKEELKNICHTSETESPKNTKLKPEIIEEDKLKKTSKSNSAVIEEKTETKSKKKCKVDATKVIELEGIKATKASETSNPEIFEEMTKQKKKSKSTVIEDKIETKPKKKSKAGSVDKLTEITNKVDSIALKDILDTKSLLDGSLVTTTKKNNSKIEGEIIEDVTKLKKTSIIEDKTQTKPKKKSKTGSIDKSTESIDTKSNSDEASITQTKKKKSKTETKIIESTVEKMIDENLISESSQHCELHNVESIKSTEPSSSVIKSEASPSEIVKNDIKITNIEIKDVDVNPNNKIIEKGTLYIINIITF